MIYGTGSHLNSIDMVLASDQRLACNIQLESGPSVVDSVSLRTTPCHWVVFITQRNRVHSRPEKENLKTRIDFGVFFHIFYVLYVNKVPS